MQKSDCPFSQFLQDAGCALELTNELEQAMDDALQVYRRPPPIEKPEELPRTVDALPDKKTYKVS